MDSKTRQNEQQGNSNNGKFKYSSQKQNQGGSSSSSAKRKPHMRPIHGNTPGQHGNPIGFKLPGTAIVQNPKDIERFWHNEKWTETTYEYFIVDDEGDTLMCQCLGLAEPLCLNYCARNLFNQKGQSMWISEHDRRELEQAMINNHALQRPAESDDIF